MINCAYCQQSNDPLLLYEANSDWGTWKFIDSWCLKMPSYCIYIMPKAATLPAFPQRCWDCPGTYLSFSTAVLPTFPLEVSLISLHQGKSDSKHKIKISLTTPKCPRTDEQNEEKVLKSLKLISSGEHHMDIPVLFQVRMDCLVSRHLLWLTN